jgi:hypothetical protein
VVAAFAAGPGIASFGTNPALTQLSGVAVLNRCAVQLTQGTLDPADPLIAQVSSGALSPGDACIAILDRAALIDSGGAQGGLAADTPQGRAILRAMNDFHRTWFPNDTLVEATPQGDFAPRTNLLHDESEAALHLTRALFTQSVKFQEIVTGTSGMEALRSEGVRNENFATQRPTDGAASIIAVQGVQKGDLIGVRPFDSNPAKRDLVLNTSGLPGFMGFKGPLPNANGDVNVHQSLGGGILGTRSYLMLNLGRPDYQPMNGGLRMPRRWAKAIFSNLMCRDIPVLRFEDAAQFVQPAVAGRPPFRSGQSCMTCHGAIDQMGMTARNAAYGATPAPRVDPNDSTQIVKFDVTLPREVGFVDDDPNFNQRPPNGRLLFRSYTGDLVSKDVLGVSELGQALADTDDLYVCAASRYFQFFTGIGLNLRDPGDLTTTPLTDGEKAYQAQVEILGKQLKTNQSLRELLRSIFNSPIYQSSSMRLPK